MRWVVWAVGIVATAALMATGNPPGWAAALSGAVFSVACILSYDAGRRDGSS